MLEDQSRAPPDVDNDQIITWYKNMVTGTEVRMIPLVAQNSGLHGGYFQSIS
jgi:hypothetical protein